MSATTLYPLGLQNFKDLITSGCIYIDKTSYIRDMISNYRFVFLSRPRRFGKSLLLSTIDYFFSEGNKDLFKGLEISRTEKQWQILPVIRIDLSAESYENADKLLNKINLILSGYEKIYGTDPAETTIAGRFSGIITRAAAGCLRKVVVLIDEYDKPLLENVVSPVIQEGIRLQLRGFMSVLKEKSEFIRFALITGVTKFSHVSIFSGLNNLKDISLKPEYNAICGVSETEFSNCFKDSLENFAEINGITADETARLFRENYDGYHFSYRGEGIYNPFSIMNAFDDNIISNYWIQTATPKFIPDLFKERSFPIRKLEGVEKTINQLMGVVGTDDVSIDNTIVMLYQAGYLTINGFTPSTQKCRLGFPNQEVKNSFWESLYTFFISSSDSKGIYSLEDFSEEIQRGETSRFMKRLKSLVASLSPSNLLDREVYFQNTVEIIFKMLGQLVETEVHSASGRSDMIVRTSKVIYIFEFKIDSTPEKAISQIIEKGYAEPYLCDHRAIELIGATFSTSTNRLESFLIDRLKR